MKHHLVLKTVVLLTLANSIEVFAHCEVPCGIYADQRRFEEMLEDTATINKAIEQIRELSKSLEANTDALAINQAARWVSTKEAHATNTQHIIAQYFMTQRIKSSAEGYVGKLKAAHAVMVKAMKCKQTADPAMAENLEKAILDFYRAYEGKEPHFHD